MKTSQLLLKIEQFNIIFLLFLTYLDFLKNIERFDWDFIFSTKQKFRYGEKSIRMIKVAYTNIQCKIKINGLLSNLFTLMQGVRQGYPLSMLLCIISAEVLTNFVDTDKRIKGIQIGDH